MVVLAGIVCSRRQERTTKVEIFIKLNYNTCDRFRWRQKRENKNHQLLMQEMNVNTQKINFAGTNKAFKSIKYLIKSPCVVFVLLISLFQFNSMLL